MPPITLYLHIGSGKTGTTAIQRFFKQNFSKLLELGVLYPNFDDEDVFVPMKSELYRHGRYFKHSDGSDDLKLFNRCIQYCKENSLHSIVISNEAMFIDYRERIMKLAGKLDADVKIICYVRRQDHYLESIWKQWGYRFFSADELLETIDRKEWQGWKTFDWYTALEPWATNFGKENIIVRPYEKEQLPDGVLPDFLNTIGILWPEKPEVNPLSTVNLGFSRDVLEFLYLNRELNLDPTDFRVYNLVNSTLDNHFRKKAFEPYEILSPKDRIELLKKYEAANQRVAREYLGREDGRLFYEPWSTLDKDWHPYPGLRLETLIPILTGILYFLFERQQKTSDNYKELLHSHQKLAARFRTLEAQYQTLSQHQKDSLATYPATFPQKLKRFLSKILRILQIRK